MSLCKCARVCMYMCSYVCVCECKMIEAARAELMDAEWMKLLLAYQHVCAVSACTYVRARIYV